MKYQREIVYWVKHCTINGEEAYRCKTKTEQKRMVELCMKDEDTITIEVETKEFLWKKE